METTMEALLKLKEEGAIKAIGLSNHEPELILRACGVGPVDCLQDHFSILKQDVYEKVQPLCNENKISFMAYAPLGGGILSGKYKTQPQFGKGDVRSFFYPFYREPCWTRTKSLLDRMEQMAKAYSATTAAIAIAWIRSHEEVCSVLTGSKNAEQARQNALADRVKLSDDEVAELKELGKKAVESK